MISSNHIHTENSALTTLAGGSNADAGEYFSNCLECGEFIRQIYFSDDYNNTVYSKWYNSQKIHA